MKTDCNGGGRFFGRQRSRQGRLTTSLVFYSAGRTFDNGGAVGIFEGMQAEAANDALADPVTLDGAAGRPRDQRGKRDEGE